jgi:hypothetical protein
MAAKKPQDLRDIINAANKLFSKPSPRGATAQASAVVSRAQNVSNKSTQAVAKGSNKAVAGMTSTMKSQLGDPSKGWKDVASKSGVWLIPYGKGYKLVNKAIKGAKYYKSAKAARGAVKGAIVLGADTALNTGVNKLPSGKKP